MKTKSSRRRRGYRAGLPLRAAGFGSAAPRGITSMRTTGSSFSTRFCSARRSAGGAEWVNQRWASFAPAKRLMGKGIFGWSVNRSAASSRPAARMWAPSCREIQLLAPRVGLALVEVRHGRLAGAEVDLDLPNVRLAAALDPAEAVLGELGLEAQPIVLDGDAAILETPHRVHHEPVTLELLGELAVGDELAALIAHRREAVQVGLRIPQRHAPGRQGEEQGAQRQGSGLEVHCT